tara:strand:+ start:202 stop:540 length:339 start_codon:yes stop_codon:yes gene_type:complete
MKFNLNNLENKLNKINDTSLIINNTINNFDNKKKIETIVYTLLLILQYYFNIRKKEYLEQISYFSPNYLIGSDWYIGEEYTYEDFWNEQDYSVKMKFFIILYFMNSLYQKIC